jgi:C-terminal processing protease CtpA/Prc
LLGFYPAAPIVIELHSNSGQFRTSKAFVYAFVRIVALVTAGAISACGGGGGGGGFTPPPTSPPPGSGWQQGVFLAASTFAAQCAAPRSGIDPATGSSYPDIQGTTTDENNFLRSYSDDTYLWYDEIVDQDPGLFNDPLAYFDELKTTATTPSGADKDKFHFTFDSEEWFQLSQSGVSAGYGAEFIFLSTTPPREVVVAYTEPNSPATDPAVMLARGATLLAIDSVDINDNTQAGVDTLNAGLFPDGAGEMHTFEVLDLGAQNSRMVTMTSAIITEDPVQAVSTFNTPTGDVGYMVFNAHRAPAEAELVAAINQLQGVSDLVLDIRYNGGGFLDIASQLAYMIAGNIPTAGQTFEEIQFNDKHPSTDPVTGQALSPTPFHNQTLGFSVGAGQALPTLDLDTVYVLTGPNTCSASEAIMNGLRGVNVNVIQIGSTTCGKPYGFYARDNCGTTYFTIQFKGVNAMNFGDYTDGFSPANTQANAGTIVPGCSVADDFTAQLGDTSEGRLAAALAYRTTQSCPAPSGIAQPGFGKPGAPLAATDGIILQSPWDRNRIYRQ